MKQWKLVIFLPPGQHEARRTTPTALFLASQNSTHTGGGGGVVCCPGTEIESRKYNFVRAQVDSCPFEKCSYSSVTAAEENFPLIFVSHHSEHVQPATAEELATARIVIRKLPGPRIQLIQRLNGGYGRVRPVEAMKQAPKLFGTRQRSRCCSCLG